MTTLRHSPPDHYLTLFIAAGVLIDDVTSIVYNLLSGEMTTRFAGEV